MVSPAGIDEVQVAIISKKLTLADFYYDNFLIYYQKKIFSKASEFLWGSLNNLVYILGLLRGENIDSHKKVIDMLQKIGVETKDSKMQEQINAATLLHRNFFHNFMDEPIFEENKNKMVDLLEKLKKMCDKEISKTGIKIYKESQQSEPV